MSASRVSLRALSRANGSLAHYFHHFPSLLGYVGQGDQKQRLVFLGVASESLARSAIRAKAGQPTARDVQPRCGVSRALNGRDQKSPTCAARSSFPTTTTTTTYSLSRPHPRIVHITPVE